MVRGRVGDVYDSRYGSGSSVSDTGNSCIDRVRFWDCVMMLGEWGDGELAFGVKVEFVVCISTGGRESPVTMLMLLTAPLLAWMPPVMCTLC